MWAVRKVIGGCTAHVIEFGLAHVEMASLASRADEMGCGDTELGAQAVISAEQVRAELITQFMPALFQRGDLSGDIGFGATQVLVCGATFRAQIVFASHELRQRLTQLRVLFKSDKTGLVRSGAAGGDLGDFILQRFGFARRNHGPQLCLKVTAFGVAAITISFCGSHSVCCLINPGTHICT